MANLYKIKSNELIAKEVYRMVLEGDTSKITKPGQFINVKVEGFYLRRPISVCDWDSKTITIVFKTFGHGTKELSTYKVGREIDCLVGLGNGFEVVKEDHSLIVAGGVGTPPMIGLAKAQIKKGNKVTVLLGYSNKEDVMLKGEFKKIGCEIHVATLDGTDGFKGNVIELFTDLNITYNSYYACGPNGLLKALQANLDNGFISLEERMACGFGACMGCSCKVTTGYKRICREGPVFDSKEVTL